MSDFRRARATRLGLAVFGLALAGGLWPALGPAHAQTDDAVVILAGDAPGRDAYREELICLITHHGLGNKVRLVGHCREMPAAYLASQVAVTTSTVPETFGRTSAEAQAMGCPVIAMRSGTGWLPRKTPRSPS